MPVLAVRRRGKRGIENKGADIKRIDQVVILLFAADGDELDDLAVLLADVGRPEAALRPEENLFVFQVIDVNAPFVRERVVLVEADPELIGDVGNAADVRLVDFIFGDDIVKPPLQKPQRQLLAGNVLMMCVLMTIPMFAFAAVSGDEPLTIGTPFMITNAGQGPGGKMGRLLVSRAGTLTEDEDFYYVDVPYAADVDARDYSAIVIVIGSTDKGLGATGITIDQEIARVDEVVARANEKGIPVIAVMLEKDKRSDVKTNSNERCIDAVCPHASWMIVTADVNTDGRYDAFKAENGTPLTILDSSMDFISLVQQAFVKE